MSTAVDPIIDKLQQMGCYSQLKLSIAYHVYLDLRDVQGLHNAECHYSKNLDVIYITGYRDNTEDTEVFIPLCSSSFLSTGWIDTLQNDLLENKEQLKITLAIKEQDSSVVYYSVTKGLVPPNLPVPKGKDGKKSKKRKMNHKGKIG